MYATEQARKYFDLYKDLRRKLRARNGYYYGYIKTLLDFFVPKDVALLAISEPTIAKLPADGSLDYIALSDVLGYVYDIQGLLSDVQRSLRPDGRVVITQYSALWEPLLRLASLLNLRMPQIEQNWLSMIDLTSFLNLAGFDVVKSGTKMLCPIYIPLVSAFVNRFLANIFPLNKLGLIHYAVARKTAVAKPASGMSAPSFSIVVPARNEAGTIEKIVESIPVMGSYTEVILIEGNSTDNTREVMEHVVKTYRGPLWLKFGVQDGRGKGDAVRKGFDMATGDILTIYDADMTVPPEDLPKFYEAMVTGRGDFINGSRLVYPMEKQSMRLLNFFGNKFFSYAFSNILGQPLKDTLCGTKVIWRKDYDAVKHNRAFFGDFDPFGDFDLLFGAAKLNLKIIDLPVHYKERVYGTTNISRWKHGWLLLRMTFFAAGKLKFR